MDSQDASTSKVTVEYHDPHDVYKLLAPGLIPQLPLHNLHWQSHAGPLRSIPTLHVDLVRGGDGPIAPASTTPALRRSDSTARDDGFQAQSVGGRTTSLETVGSSAATTGSTAAPQRRHQIPGLRQSPYLKVLLVRCDDNDSYKATVRSEVREWIKDHAPSPSPSSSKKARVQERHDAFEWLVIHVVLPNTTAATQPRTTSVRTESAASEGKTSRWRTGSTPLLEKFQSDFNSSAKGAVDHVAQIRIGINDVPYDLLPRVIPAVPTGYMETEQDAQRAWEDLLDRLKDLILVSFDRRVSQYEDDIKEKESQRALPGWNFCTFFILKEGLARGFESVGLVDDALVGYDELSVGLDSFVAEQNAGGNLGRQGGGLLQYTESLKQTIDALALDSSNTDDETVDLQSDSLHKESVDEIPINAARRPYRDMILANDVSAFDFRCYLFSRQIALLLRLANAQSTREELLAQLKEQQDSILYGVAPRVPAQQKKPEEKENLAKLAEICHRALEFIPQITHVMRQELLTAYAEEQQTERAATSLRDDVINNVISSFGFSVAQQILAQTSTKALPIPSSTISFPSDDEQKASIPEPKTMMHPARESSLHIKTPQQDHQPPPSPGVFPGPGQHPIIHQGDSYEAYLAKNGLEELAAKRGDLYMFSRSILTNFGKPRGWSAGWDEAPIMHELGMLEMVDIDLSGDDGNTPDEQGKPARDSRDLSLAGINSKLLRTAADNSTDFYRLYEILTDKALRHFTVAGLERSIQGAMSDLAVLKYHLQEYRAATSFFCLTTPFYGESGWSWLELSMLVIYTNCLKHLKSKEFVRVALKLLTKACATQKDHQKPGTLAGSVSDGSVRAGISAVVNDAVGKLSDLALALPGDAKVPLDSFITDVCLESMPAYHDDRDSATMSIRLQSLLPSEATFDSVTLQLVTDNVAHTEVIFRAAEQTLIVPGPNVITLHCSSIIPGLFRVGRLCLQSSHLSLSSDYDASSSKQSAHRFKPVLLHRPASALHVALSASRHMTLNKTNHLELTVHTGNNSVKSCEVRIRPATGGLRMLMNEAVCVGQPDCFAKPPEAGVFRLGALPRDSPAIIQFPYTIEQDVAEIVAKLDVTYRTDQDGPFATSETSKIPISLAVGVNVQDIFKHSFMYSRFSVSTGSTQPLRLYDSELLDSDIFEATRSGLASSTLDIFPDQPTTLVYKVQRKSIGEHVGKSASRTLHLKLRYNRLNLEIEELLRHEIMEALAQTPWTQYQRLVESVTMEHMHSYLDHRQSERASLLGEVSTDFLASIPWQDKLLGLGSDPAKPEDPAVAIPRFFREWLQTHQTLPLPSSNILPVSSILIPVEVPSVSVVHTIDLRLSPTPDLISKKTTGELPVVVIGQVAPAILCLKSTRRWCDPTKAPRGDQVFSYEVTAPLELWTLGGRRRGHFVVPQASNPMSDEETSIPIVMIPQREGWIPLPTVEIRELDTTGEPLSTSSMGFEVDSHNIGETVHVVGGRESVTVSLDASGQGGGPLILEGPRVGRTSSQVVA